MAKRFSPLYGWTPPQDHLKVLTKLAAVDPAHASDDDMHAALPELLTAVNQLDAITARTVASFDTANSPTATAAKPPAPG